MGHAVAAGDRRPQWLDDHRAGQAPGDADPFPGHYTQRTLAHGKITGMLSVNATTGQVCYHGRYGELIAMTDD
ncbi:hypothetical protein [Streptomyces sp. NPDC058457]|uniref:hypothetical protein n=1 Tax=Streptomyces sp. NPDC058457 TaxID=3346507 RepID=UPI00365DE2F3